MRADAGDPSRAGRAALLGHGSALLWLTGLPGAGKSTLASALERRLLQERVLSAVIDGDVLRTGLSRDLRFTLEDRRENVRRAGELGLALAGAGAVAIVALISPMRADRRAIAERAAALGVPFAEVFISASLAACERRDPKGHYRRARAGEIPLFTGVDSPYEPPLAPALVLRTDAEPVGQSVDTLAEFALRLVRPGEAGRPAATA